MPNLKIVSCRQGITSLTVVIIIIAFILLIVGEIFFINYLVDQKVKTLEQTKKTQAVSLPAQESPTTEIIPIMPNTVSTALEVTGVGLDINLQKETYGVNEKFENAKYRLLSTKDSFLGYITVTHFRKDIKKDIDAEKMTFEIEKNKDYAFELFPFHLDTDGSYAAGVESFDQPGEYGFTVEIYDCAKWDLDENTCKYSNITEKMLSDTKPEASVTKTITVTDKAAVAPQENAASATPALSEKNVLDCDFGEGSDPTCVLSFVDAFITNLNACTVSQGTAPIGFEPIMGIFRSYNILGIKDDLCLIEYSFLDTTTNAHISAAMTAQQVEPMPSSLLNKKMTCSYAADKRDINAVASLDGCSGPLYEELQKLQPK